MAKQKESIAVIVPIYIGVDLPAFQTSMQSLLNQTKQPDELVIVIDGPVKEVLWTYISETFLLNELNFSVTLVCCLKNTGPGYARTLAASITSSTWLAIHDADDRYVSNRLEVQSKYLSDEVDVLGAYIQESYDEGGVQIQNIRSVPLTDRDIKAAMSHYSPVNNATAIIRKEIFLKVGGYPSLRFGEDYVLWNRIKQMKGRFLNLPYAVAFILVDDDFFYRRRGFSLFIKEFQYLNLMRKERHVNLFIFSYKLIRAFSLRFIPLGTVKLIYRIARK